MDVQALVLSVQLATVVSLCLLVLGLPLAYWLALSRWRWKFLVESVVALPLVLPPTVLGFYVLVAIGARSPVGRLWSRWFGHGLAFTFEGLAMASVLYSLPFAVQPFTAAFYRSTVSSSKPRRFSARRRGAPSAASCCRSRLTASSQASC